jgi:hypothetical protein
MPSGARAYNDRMAVDPVAVVFALAVVVAIELWWRARSR